MNELENTRIKTVHIHYDTHLYYMHTSCFFYTTHTFFRVKTHDCSLNDLLSTVLFCSYLFTGQKPGLYSAHTIPLLF